MKRERLAIVAIYCPLWHRYDHMDSWKGEGWCEWELLKTAPRRFPGHYQPYRPTWGCFDESDPKWSTKEIALAADHGVDVLLFDWYWYNGVRIMEEALERGFLQAPNCKRVRFALMWANHHWWDYFPAPFEGPWNWWMPMRHSPRDLQRAVNYCVEHYFRQPNYWRLEDKLFFSVFQPEAMVEQLGGVETTRRLFRQLDRQLNSRGLPGMHWNAMLWSAKPVPRLKAAGFHSTTTYNVTSSGRIAPRDNLIEHYEAVMVAHQRQWRAMTSGTLPYMPVVTVGWDVTPRCQHDVPWPFPPPKRLAPNHPFGNPKKSGQRVYPYGHVVVGNTPARFGQLCREAAEYLREMDSPLRVVFVNAWNEWTEGSFLLPEKRYGKGYLEALRDAFRPLDKMS